MEVLTPSSNALNWCASLFHTGSLCDENNPPVYLETHSPRHFCFGFDSKLVESGLELIFGVCAQSWCNFGPPCRPDGLDIPKATYTLRRRSFLLLYVATHWKASYLDCLVRLQCMSQLRFLGVVPFRRILFQNILRKGCAPCRPPNQEGACQTEGPYIRELRKSAFQRFAEF